MAASRKCGVCRLVGAHTLSCPNRVSPTPKRLVSRREAAGLVGVGLRWIDTRVADGELRRYQRGRTIRLDPDEVLGLFRSTEVDPLTSMADRAVS